MATGVMNTGLSHIVPRPDFEYKIGVYTGDGNFTDGQHIDTGFTPDAVYVQPYMNTGYGALTSANYQRGIVGCFGLATRDSVYTSPSSGSIYGSITVESSGFRVFSSSASSYLGYGPYNVSGITFCYFAMRYGTAVPIKASYFVGNGYAERSIDMGFEVDSVLAFVDGASYYVSSTDTMYATGSLGLLVGSLPYTSYNTSTAPAGVEAIRVEGSSVVFKNIEETLSFSAFNRQSALVHYVAFGKNDFMVSGSYDGNYGLGGTASQQISLDFTPSAVFAIPQGGTMPNILSATLANYGAMCGFGTMEQPYFANTNVEARAALFISSEQLGFRVYSQSSTTISAIAHTNGTRNSSAPTYPIQYNYLAFR